MKAVLQNILDNTENLETLNREQLLLKLQMIREIVMCLIPQAEDDAMKRHQYKEWTLIDWDGNPDLKLKCWRKSFGRGHVSVGCGDFLTIVFSFGANSDRSYSSTRWRPSGPITEEAAKVLVDDMASKGLL